MYIKTNNEVKNKEDIQNLITSVILRQTKPFSSGKIRETVNVYLRGSDFYKKYKLIEELVDDTLNLFTRADLVACWAGIWYPKDINGFFITEYYIAKRNCVY